MPITKYAYLVATDFPGGQANISKLDSEIRGSAIVTALDRIESTATAVDVYFKAALPAADKTILDGDQAGPAGGLIAAHDNTPTASSLAVEFLDKAGAHKPVPFDADGNIKFVAEPPTGSKLVLVSVNWCDKCSWYEGSVQVSGEAMSDMGAGLTWDSANENWIDMRHGRITDEDGILAANPGKWLASVTVDGVAKSESPAGATSGDYQVDYPAGRVTFNSPQVGAAVVATYWRAATGVYTLKPKPGKRLKILFVEVQFSKDLVLNDTMKFVARGYAGVFAPQYVPVPFAATDLIELTAPNRYKTAFDYVNESNGCYPIIPAFGGTGWRGLSQEVLTLPWKYVTRTDLLSSAGMEIRITMEGNTPQGGQLATATFYCVSDDE
jgi:hypothetical protein